MQVESLHSQLATLGEEYRSYRATSEMMMEAKDAEVLQVGLFTLFCV